MLFNSISFLFFFPIVTLAYFLLPHRLRWVLLLSASCYFYMQFIPAYILFLFYMITVDYAAGILMEKWVDRPKYRKAVLLTSISSNLGMLFVFKYYGFFETNFNALSQFLNWNYSLPALRFILPLGLSFHTFQSLNYIIEVYRKNQKVENHYGIFALYIMFYPQLVAGPIERARNMLPQFYEVHVFDEKRVSRGLRLMLWGFFQKVVIADRLAVYVNQVYADTSFHAGSTLLLATLFFAFQIYCDFSGYCDIAIGAAEVMGFKLTNNFKRPYFATSIVDFWHRWHVSLSTWFRDYVYIPLGGNQASKPRWCLNIMITFLISGLWHGANWTFMLWGCFHGVWLIVSVMTQKWREVLVRKIGLSQFPNLQHIIRVLLTFSGVTFGWIFFRAQSIREAGTVISRIFLNFEFYRLHERVEYYEEDYVIAYVSIILLLLVQFLQAKGIDRYVLSSRPIWLRWSIYYLATLSLLFFAHHAPQKFIYFQF